MKTDTETSKYLSQFDNELITIMHEQGSKLKAVKFLHEKKLGIPLREILSYCDQLQNIEYNSYQELVITAVNACKDINPDNPLNVASHLVEFVEMYKKLQMELEYFINATPTGDKRVQLTGLNILALVKLGQITE